MQTEGYKKQIIVSVILAFIFTSLIVILFWNAFVSGKDSPGIWPFIVYLLVLFILGNIINNALKGLDPGIFKEALEKEISEERMKILKELEKKDVKDDSASRQDILQKKQEAILPKGNFKNTNSYAEKLFSNTIKEFEFVQGIIYLRDKKAREFKFLSGFGLPSDQEIHGFKPGETLPGQAAISREVILIDEIPEEYFETESGLGKAKPRFLVFIPLVVKNEVEYILELAAFKKYDDFQEVIKYVLTEVTTKLELLNKA